MLSNSLHTVLLHTNVREGLSHQNKVELKTLSNLQVKMLALIIFNLYLILENYFTSISGAHVEVRGQLE